MEINQSNASRHLSKLKQVGLIKGEQKAQWVYYRINKDLFVKHNFLQNILDSELESLVICQDDNQRLTEYQASGISCEELGENDLL